jgi:glucoamylase
VAHLRSIAAADDCIVRDVSCYVPPSPTFIASEKESQMEDVVAGSYAPRMRRWIRGVAITAALATAAVTNAQTSGDGPGALSHFGLARKDCLGTARNTTSKVWFTIANGALSDVYYPTVDNTDVETLQYMVTDGATFSDLQTRNMTYSVRALGPSGMLCRVTTTGQGGEYQIVTDYVTDPSANTLLMRVRFKPRVPNLKLYVRLDPSVNGNGGGGAENGGADSATIDTSTGHPVAVAFDTVTATNATNRDYAQPVFMALDASRPLNDATVGFVDAASDGLPQLDFAGFLFNTFTDAPLGNVVVTAPVDFRRDGGVVTLALGFGATQAEAVSAAEDSLASGFPAARRAYRKGWKAYDASLVRPPSTLPGLKRKRVKALRDTYYLSANLVKAAEDKTFPGAIVASLAAPWGQAISAGDPSNTFVGFYREVFPRHLYQAWTALLVAGDLDTARATVDFLFARQQHADGSMPRTSLLNGMPAPDSFGSPVDATAYAIMMADQLGMTDPALYQDHVRPAADFLIARGPVSGPERWEEQSGYSPSTFAAEIAGLVAAAHLAQANGDVPSAQVFLGVADDFQRSVRGATVTTNGPLSASPYFIRLSKSGDPNAAISYNVGNGGPTLDQRAVIDAGFLELSRLGALPASDGTFADSLAVVDADLESVTPSGPGWHRYSGDGYGDAAGTGVPWAPTDKGTGHLWPVLNAERAAYALETGDATTAASLLDAMASFGGGVGLIPEQDWELPDLAPSPFGTDPTLASIGFTTGQPDGSASPLTWSAAAFVRMLGDLGAGQLLEQPETTSARYVAHAQGQTSLTVTSPADMSAGDGSPLIVTGVTTGGNSVYVVATNTDTFDTTSGSTTAAADGTFSVSVPVTAGTTVLNTVAVSPSGDTGHDKRSALVEITPGTVVLDATDPDHDDNGPGNYAYPTASDFHPGAFDLEEFQVIVSPDASTVTFKLRVRDLTATFGSPLGAQLVDVYVHDPSAAGADTSTAAAFPQRNYVLAPSAAWSRLLEVQGFGQRFEDAHGSSVGTISIDANAISRFITFSVPTAALGGEPGAGWGFAVALTGEDGFETDLARAFTATPGSFTFGVCAAASADAHCTAGPTTVPKVLDVLTPSGILQSDELDYTVHSPVTVQAVGIS